MAQKKEARNCKECNKEFVVHRDWQVFCSPFCRMQNWKRNHPHISAEDLAEIKKKLNIK